MIKHMVKHAKVSYSYETDLVGESTADYLLMYHPDETASFVAVEHINARLGDRPGTLVLRHSGCHENDAATARCEVVQGTGAFEGVCGTASYSATDRTYQLRLELDQLGC